MRTVDVRDDDLTLAIGMTTPEFNRDAYMHGGILCTLADDAIGDAARRLVGEGAHALMLEAPTT